MGRYLIHQKLNQLATSRNLIAKLSYDSKKAIALLVETEYVNDIVVINMRAMPIASQTLYYFEDQYQLF